MRAGRPLGRGGSAPNRLVPVPAGTRDGTGKAGDSEGHVRGGPSWTVQRAVGAKACGQEAGLAVCIVACGRSSSPEHPRYFLGRQRETYFSIEIILLNVLIFTCFFK